MTCLLHTCLILPKLYRLGTSYSRVRNLQGPVYSNHHPLATGEDAASHPLYSFITALAVGKSLFGLVMWSQAVKELCSWRFPFRHRRRTSYTLLVTDLGWKFEPLMLVKADCWRRWGFCEDCLLAQFPWSLCSVETTSEPPGTSSTGGLNASEEPQVSAEFLRLKKACLQIKT